MKFEQIVSSHFSEHWRQPKIKENAQRVLWLSFSEKGVDLKFCYRHSSDHRRLKYTIQFTLVRLLFNCTLNSSTFSKSKHRNNHSEVQKFDLVTQNLQIFLSFCLRFGWSLHQQLWQRSCRVAKCQFVYTEQIFQTKSYQKESALIATSLVPELNKLDIKGYLWITNAENTAAVLRQNFILIGEIYSHDY